MEKLAIGEAIFKLRKEKGVTQDQLAKFISVSTAAVSILITQIELTPFGALANLLRDNEQ